jgi:hypothetical protein
MLRDASFGEVSNRPAVTRHVEGAAVIVRDDRDRVIGEAALFDTPGLEDSIGLLDHLESLRAGRRITGVDLIEQFLASGEASGRFAQEAKAIRQVMAADIALYVVDARDRVLGKHEDELTILGYCARPVVPVLNFVAADDARMETWRGHLSRVNMHAVAEFDTVVFDHVSERRLIEKMATLLDGWDDVLTELVEMRQRERRALIDASATLAADMLIDCAAHVSVVGASDRGGRKAALESFMDRIRERERACTAAMLALHRFRPGDVEEGSLPDLDGRWGVDLFSPAALREVGASAGRRGRGRCDGRAHARRHAGRPESRDRAAVGAGLGALLGAGRTHGRRIARKVQGQTELRLDDALLALLLARQITLIRTLLTRGHAAMEQATIDGEQPATDATRRNPAFDEVRQHPGWSALHEAGNPARAGSSADRSGESPWNGCPSRSPRSWPTRRPESCGPSQPPGRVIRLITTAVMSSSLDGASLERLTSLNSRRQISSADASARSRTSEAIRSKP